MWSGRRFVWRLGLGLDRLYLRRHRRLFFRRLERRRHHRRRLALLLAAEQRHCDHETTYGSSQAWVHRRKAYTPVPALCSLLGKKQ
jgi:hypothetical protein